MDRVLALVGELRLHKPCSLAKKILKRKKKKESRSGCSFSASPPSSCLFPFPASFSLLAKASQVWLSPVSEYWETNGAFLWPFCSFRSVKKKKKEEASDQMSVVNLPWGIQRGSKYLFGVLGTVLFSPHKLRETPKLSPPFYRGRKRGSEWWNCPSSQWQSLYFSSDIFNCKNSFKVSMICPSNIKQEVGFDWGSRSGQLKSVVSKTRKDA